MLSLSTNVNAAILEGVYTYLVKRNSPTLGNHEYEVKVYIKGEQVKGEFSKTNTNPKEISFAALLDYKSKKFHLIDTKTNYTRNIPLGAEFEKKSGFTVFKFPPQGKKTTIKNVELIAYNGQVTTAEGESKGSVDTYYLENHTGPSGFIINSNFSKLSIELNFLNILFSENEKNLLFHAAISLNSKETAKITLIRKEARKVNSESFSMNQFFKKKLNSAPVKK